MNSIFGLYARFESPTVELSKVSEEFFGYKIRTAKEKIKAQDFPIPTFTLTEGERAPVLIHVEDLAKYIDKKLEQAREEWQSVQSH